MLLVQFLFPFKAKPLPPFDEGFCPTFRRIALAQRSKRMVSAGASSNALAVALATSAPEEPTQDTWMFRWRYPLTEANGSKLAN